MINYQFNQEVQIPAGDVMLTGNLAVPENAKGIVVFAHGSGSSRKSSRNMFVVSVLEKEGFATLLFDLLTVAEDQNYDNRFNIGLLTQRLINATGWLRSEDQTGALTIAYFGASTGAAAALMAAAELGNLVAAVVSRGGRPDLAAPILPRVISPVLLIAGSLDTDVIELNQQAFSQMRAEREIRVVEGAGHLFEEEGKMAEVASVAASWFNKYVQTVEQ